MGLESLNPNNEQEKWNAILAKEGMPGELKPATKELSEGMLSVWNEIRRHYIERKDTETDWGVHRQRLGEIQSNISLYDLTPEEIGQVNEDLLRRIQDEVTEVETEAFMTAEEISKKQPLLVTKETFATRISKRLEKVHSDYEPNILMIVAHAAAENIQHRMSRQ